MADSQDTATDKQPTNTKPITEVYAFELGKRYVIEVDMRYMTRREIKVLSDRLQAEGLRVVFVPTSNGQVLRPVPAVEGIDLVATDKEAL